MTEIDNRTVALDVMRKMAQDEGVNDSLRLSAAEALFDRSSLPEPLPASPASTEVGLSEPSRADDLSLAITMLALVWDEVPRKPPVVNFAGLDREELREIIEWAGAVHLRASDNDDVEIPPVPPILQLSPEKQGTSEMEGEW